LALLAAEKTLGYFFVLFLLTLCYSKNVNYVHSLVNICKGSKQNC